jgi:hypothetical protein
MDPAQQTLQILAEQTVLLRWYVGATLLIAAATCLALFQEQIRAALARASLSVSSAPIVSTPFGSAQNQLAHYLRLLVENTSQNTARDVEVVVERVRRRDPAAPQSQPEKIFGLNLTWSHFPGRAIMAQIGGNTSRTVDLGHVLRPSDRALHRQAGDPAVEDTPMVPASSTLLKLGTVVDPFSRAHLLEPGDWELGLRVSGANVPGQRIVVVLRLTGQWHDDVTLFANQAVALETR